MKLTIYNRHHGTEAMVNVPPSGELYGPTVRTIRRALCPLFIDCGCGCGILGQTGPQDFRIVYQTESDTVKVSVIPQTADNPDKADRVSP
jgi:hypothetical protein